MTADAYLQDFYKTYPHYSATIQSLVISKSMRARSQKTLRELFDIGLISVAVFTKAETLFSSIHRSSLLEAHRLVRPSTAYLLARIPLFKQLPRTAVGALPIR